MERIIQFARSEAFQAIEGTVLKANDAMLRMVAQLGSHGGRER